MSQPTKAIWEYRFKCGDHVDDNEGRSGFIVSVLGSGEYRVSFSGAAVITGSQLRRKRQLTLGSGKKKPTQRGRSRGKH